MKRFWILLVLLFVLVVPILAQGNGVVEQATQQIGSSAGILWERIQAASQVSMMRLLLIIAGGLLIFIGWRIYNFVILIAGAMTGAVIAVALVGDSNTVLTIIAMLIGGAIGAFLAGILYYVAVFIIGAYVGAILTAQIVIGLGLNVDVLIAMIFGGIMGGLILLGLSFELLVILSSIVGAQMLSMALGLGAGWTIGFMIFGILWQIILARILGYKIRRRPSRRMLFRDA